MDIEFSQIHEMVYMHDIVNSDSKKKPRIPGDAANLLI